MTAVTRAEPSCQDADAACPAACGTTLHANFGMLTIPDHVLRVKHCRVPEGSLSVAGAHGDMLSSPQGLRAYSTSGSKAVLESVAGMSVWHDTM